MRRSLTGPLICGMLVLSSVAATAAPFQLTSESFSNGGVAPVSIGGGGQCPGNNTSPPLSWSNAPAGTKSFVLLIEDPQGANGLGVMHFIGYGIDPSRHQFGPGELSNQALFTGGVNVKGIASYSGPCPPANADIHNYNFTIIATDLNPGALPGGLDKNGLTSRLKGHTLGAAGLVAQYHPHSQ